MAGVIRIGRAGAGGVITSVRLAIMGRGHVVAGVRGQGAGPIGSAGSVVEMGSIMGPIRWRMTGANLARISSVKAMRNPFPERFLPVAGGAGLCLTLVGCAFAGIAAVMIRV